MYMKHRCYPLRPSDAINAPNKTPDNNTNKPDVSRASTEIAPPANTTAANNNGQRNNLDVKPSRSSPAI
jgi:hypothetical protein